MIKPIIRIVGSDKMDLFLNIMFVLIALLLLACIFGS